MQKNKKINKGFYSRFAERSVICFILILALAATGAFRVFFIKIDEKFIETANLENTYTFEYQNSRGMILDYAGLPLTNVEEKTLALITPSKHLYTTNNIIPIDNGSIMQNALYGKNKDATSKTNVIARLKT